MSSSATAITSVPSGAQLPTLSGALSIMSLTMWRGTQAVRSYERAAVELSACGGRHVA